MTSNSELAVLGLASVDYSRASMMPAGTSIRSRTGSLVGARQCFTGNMGAKQVKEKLSASGLKGKELKRRVDEVLRGERSVREQLGVAWVQATIQSGFLPDAGEVRKNSAVLRFVKVAAEKPVVADPAPVTQEAALAALGVTAEEWEFMKSLKS